MYLAKALHLQFQTAIIKFTLSNLACLRYVRKSKHLHSSKSSCGLAVPAWDLKLTGSFPLAGNRPAMPCLIEINPNWDEKCQCHLLAGLLASVWEVCSKSLSQVPKQELSSKGCLGPAWLLCLVDAVPWLFQGQTEQSQRCLFPCPAVQTGARLATPELQECWWCSVGQHKPKGKDNHFSVL